ncbi:putative MFS family arabinose efflux permease [Anseongella ginsenosidimutans]|uniref:Putative MFS family arabinose efflux permease n=1 Tax=Anseongella ginsenosidimutans TaxID=496056 RepID=A0A4R3KTB3_9SPHI|nr:MFS transporter [Anseongella ginsenosidimutans]QEC53139.1 MFS transporter [Anseongella ginsenosidimutans]TCS87761.1 putative MFS family arabinose efflux permease [Anseongella ginsenosidimutans]
MSADPIHAPGRSVYRAVVSALFFLSGLCFSSWASRIPTIQQKMGLSEAGLGGVLLALPAGLMLSLPVSGWLVARAGSRAIVIASALVYSLLLIGIGLAETHLTLIICLFAFGFANNMLNISMNTQAVGVEAMYRRTVMASFHGLWSVAGFAGAAIGSVMIGNNISPFYHFTFIMAACWLIVALCFRYTVKEDSGKGEKRPLFVLPDKSLIYLGIIAFCSMICEGTMFDWSGVYFKKVVLAEKALIGAGYMAFMFTMAGSRFVADWFSTRFGFTRILQASGLFTCTGLLLAIIFPSPAPAIAGFFLVGIGVSSVVPLVYSEAGKSTTTTPGVALAAVSTIGYLGFLLGPPLIGFIAELSSLRISFLLIALMGLTIALMGRARSGHKSS